jgi:hypothetical protein
MTNISRRVWRGGYLILSLAARFRTPLLVPLVVGVLTGAVCYVGGREIASVGCGVAGFVGSLATGAANRFRRLLPFVVGDES